MTEDKYALSVIVLIVMYIFGGIFIVGAYELQMRNECLKLVADKSSADIQVICGVKK